MHQSVKIGAFNQNIVASAYGRGIATYRRALDRIVGLTARIVKATLCRKLPTWGGFYDTRCQPYDTV